MTIERSPEPVEWKGPAPFRAKVHLSGIFDRIERLATGERTELFYQLESRWCWDCGSEQADDAAHANCPENPAVELAREILEEVHLALPDALERIQRKCERALAAQESPRYAKEPSDVTPVLCGKRIVFGGSLMWTLCRAPLHHEGSCRELYQSPWAATRQQGTP